MSYKSDDNLLKLLTEENMPNFREFFLVNEYILLTSKENVNDMPTNALKIESLLTTANNAANNVKKPPIKCRRTGSQLWRNV